MSELRVDHCCHNMANLCMTREERLRSNDAHSDFYKSAGIDPATLPTPPDALVEFLADCGIYSFGSVALHYCPWCGTDLTPRRNLPLLGLKPTVMVASVEIHGGAEGWPLAEKLDREVYPPEVMATIIWRDVTWAHADKRIFIGLDKDIVCHVGLYLRNAKDGDREVRIGGIGGVMTLPDAQGKGCASAAMRQAEKLMKEADCDFGLLFCEPHNVSFYERLGWHVFDGDVFCEQPEGRVKFDMMHAMVLPVCGTPQSHTIDLCGLPW